MIQVILLTNNQVIISHSTPKIDEDSREAYFSLMYPYLIQTDEEGDMSLDPWLSTFVKPSSGFIVYPDKIITMQEPKDKLLTRYKKVVLLEDDVRIDDLNVKEEKVEREVEYPTQPQPQPAMYNEDEDLEVYEGDVEVVY